MRYIGIVFCALLAASCSSETPGRGDAAAATTDAAAAPDRDMPKFDADSAFVLLRRQVEFGPRVPGTPPHAAQLAWMTEYLRSRADTVIIQSIAHKAKGGMTVPMANVLARFNPDAPKRVLFVTHWDTRKTADAETDAAKRKMPIPGANDGASGVAVLMQLADMLGKQKAPIGVDLLFTDGEDWETNDMYIGAKHFAATMTGYRPLYGVLIDMVGDRNPVFPVEQYSQQYAPEVIDRVYRAAGDLGLGQFFPMRPGLAVSDDHLSLNAAGIRTIDIIDMEYGPSDQEYGFGAYWHTLNDTVENTSPVGLGAVGRLLAYLAYSGG